MMCFWLRHNLCCGDCFRVDALLGYRYLGLTGRLGITEDLTSTDPNSPTTPLGTRLTVTAEGDVPGFAASFLARRAEKQFRGDFARLKEILES